MYGVRSYWSSVIDYELKGKAISKKSGRMDTKKFKPNLQNVINIEIKQE
jgi:hypothetical protein